MSAVQWAMAKVLKVSDGCVSNQKRFIYINTPTKALGAQWKRGKKEWRMERIRKRLFSGQDMAVVVMNSRQLWLPVQDLPMMEFINIPVQTGRDG